MKKQSGGSVMQDFMFFLLFLIVSGIGYGFFAFNQSPLPLAKPKVSPTPVPTLDFKTWPSPKNGVVSMRFGWSNMDGGVINPAPVPTLAQVIKNYPKAKRFELNWYTFMGGAHDSFTVIYDRKSKKLRTESLVTQGDYKSLLYSLYGKVDDVDLFKAARIPNADFDDLSGCELLSTNAKHHKKWRKASQSKTPFKPRLIKPSSQAKSNL